MPVFDTLTPRANGFRRILLGSWAHRTYGRTDPFTDARGDVREPELTIAAGLLTLGAAAYVFETYLTSSLLLDGGDPLHWSRFSARSRSSTSRSLPSSVTCLRS